MIRIMIYVLLFIELMIISVKDEKI